MAALRGMKIGELATAAATPVETIRFYERAGLMPAPARSEGNFRVYESGHLERLLFIRHCRGLDMSLDEVRVLLRVKDGPADDCGDADALIDEHIGHVSRRIAELRALERQLKALRQRCAGARDAEQCGILAGLAEAAQATGAGAAPERERDHLATVHGRTPGARRSVRAHVETPNGKMRGLVG
jgi:Cd(II)/Pb(II)-responsive transcriptional regulator